jgi:hypothetical protein
LANKPGEGAKLARALVRAKVNIQAISILDSAECGIVRLVTSSNAKAKQALRKAKMTVIEHPVLLLRLVDQPGAMAEVAAKLAAAKVNISFAYGSAAGPGKKSLVVLGVDDLAKAAKVV